MGTENATWKGPLFYLALTALKLSIVLPLFSLHYGNRSLGQNRRIKHEYTLISPQLIVEQRHIHWERSHCSTCMWNVNAHSFRISNWISLCSLTLIWRCCQVATLSIHFMPTIAWGFYVHCFVFPGFPFSPMMPAALTYTHVNIHLGTSYTKLV